MITAGLLADHQIRELVHDTGMISPFYEQLIREVVGRRVVSFGLSSYGYDVQLSPEGLRVFSSRKGLAPIDVKRAGQLDSVDYMPCLYLQGVPDDEYTGEEFYVLPPRAYALGVTAETFNMPRDVTGICVGKSTYARAGLIVNTTPLEAGWTGRLVVELSNATDLPLRVYANEGIAQVQFHLALEECVTSYADRDGKYQGQDGIVLAKV